MRLIFKDSWIIRREYWNSEISHKNTFVYKCQTKLEIPHKLSLTSSQNHEKSLAILEESSTVKWNLLRRSIFGSELFVVLSDPYVRSPRTRHPRNPCMDSFPKTSSHPEREDFLKNATIETRSNSMISPEQTQDHSLMALRGIWLQTQMLQKATTIRIYPSISSLSP